MEKETRAIGVETYIKMQAQLLAAIRAAKIKESGDPSFGKGLEQFIQTDVKRDIDYLLKDNNIIVKGGKSHKTDTVEVSGFISLVSSKSNLKEDLIKQLSNDIDQLGEVPTTRFEFVENMLECTDGSYEKVILKDAKNLRNYKVVITFEEVETKYK